MYLAARLTAFRCKFLGHSLQAGEALQSGGRQYSISRYLRRVNICMELGLFVGGRMVPGLRGSVCWWRMVPGLCGIEGLLVSGRLVLVLTALG